MFCPFDGTKLEAGGTEMQLAKPNDEFAPGGVIGGIYRVDKILGEGGMGIVFSVMHLKLNKRFALKLLKRELARDPETRARFLVEAQAAGQIRHPNVVEITDYTTLPDGGAYMVMEYLEGKPLSRMIKLGGAFPALRAVNIIKNVASALQAAHDAGVVHRDLKPDNVFIVQLKDSRGESHESAKILDFGVAKVAGGAKLTRTGMVFGTPHYMSPEQASGGAIDHRTDVYALGVIMYEMFTGRVPFEADTYMGVLTKHMFEAPIPPSKVGGTARELGALEDVTLKALAKRPEERYGSMNELAADLDRIVKIAADGSVEVAKALEGFKRPDFPAGAEERKKALARLNLADELEPPARAEITAAMSNVREKRVRRIGVVAVISVVALGFCVTMAALVVRGQQQKEKSASEAPKSTPRPVETAANPVQTAPSTNAEPPSPTGATTPEPPNAFATASATAEPPTPVATAATTNATTNATTTTATAPPPPHPTGVVSPPKPPKKPPVITDVEDPWKSK